MDYFVSGVSPAQMMGPSLGPRSTIRTEEDANKAFISLFLSQILKNVMKSQSTLYGNAQGASAFSQDLYNDILISKIAEDLSKSKMFGFEEALGLDKQLDPSRILRDRGII